MWSVYFETSPARILATRLLATVSRRAYYGAFAPLRARALPSAALPGRRWVRVRNTVAGITEQDVALAHLRADPRISLAAPRTLRRIYLGREVVGEVVQVGPDVSSVQVGERVAYQRDHCCPTREIEPPCRHCAIGNFDLCEHRYLPGPENIGGGLGEELLAHEQQLFLVPDGLTDEQAALLEPAAVGVHAALRHQPQPGESVLVLGADTVGLLTIQALRALAPNVAIAALPTAAYQVEMATRMGATHILYQEDGTAGVARLTNAQHYRNRLGAEMLLGGFDAIYDTVGSATTLQNALRWTRGGGTVVLVGKQLLPLRLDMTPLWHQEITLIGALNHGTEKWPGASGPAAWGSEGSSRVSSFALAAALIRERRLQPERVVTHRFPLREARLALRTAHEKAEHRALKVLVDIREVAAVPAPSSLPLERGRA